MNERRACQADSCDRPARPYRPYCGTHSHRFYKYGDPLAHIPVVQRTGLPLLTGQHDRVPLADRFYPRLSPVPSGCIEWTGPLDDHGYGRISEGGRGGRILKAHRVGWELLNGPVPDGLYVLHHCDNPPCCNPAHLFLGDQVANVQDMIAKGRDRFYFKTRLQSQ